MSQSAQIILFLFALGIAIASFLYSEKPFDTSDMTCTHYVVEKTDLPEVDIARCVSWKDYY